MKADIVASYFAAWSSIMAKRAERIGYFDFFAGPGRYKGGETSTPLLILKRAIASKDLAARLVTVFNDANPEFTKSLQEEIDQLEGIERLTYKPQVFTGEITDELVEQYEKMQTIPALSFIDPWGYKGLSLRLIRAVIKDWGCEVIFFFNYNRINMGITNEIVEDHMAALFGEDRLEVLRQEIETLNPPEREAKIKRRLGEALEENGAPYLIPFTFRREQGRVSHYICFVSKHPLGYSIMKDVMATHGAVDEDGVPLFEYLPASGGRQLAFDQERPLQALPENLLATFAGQTLKMEDVHKIHNVGTPFIKKNYKRVLTEMEERGAISCEPRQGESRRRKGTMADRIMISFPQK